MDLCILCIHLISLVITTLCFESELYVIMGMSVVNMCVIIYMLNRQGLGQDMLEYNIFDYIDT